MARDVTSTYRLQLHEGFTFADAAAQLDYLAALGVSHLYLSPVLQAVPGSLHGYDVVDHSRISEELGGRAGLEELAAAAHSRGLGLVVDLVPNHMAVPTPEHLNDQLWQVLRDGRDADTADWFDIDWRVGGGRLGLPVLGSPLPEVLAAGEISLDRSGNEPVLRYYDHAWPVSPGTDDIDDVGAVLDRQHYRPAYWRDRDRVLNYRRFFEVDTLIAIRVERPEVFDATHRLLLELNHAGVVDGLRVDHPDGLADPIGYFERLSDRVSRGTPIWAEKILEPGERLPRPLRCSGTTGYDALRVVQSALTDPEAADTVARAWADAGDDADYEHAVDVAKREVIQRSLSPEVDRLTRRARQVLPEAAPGDLRAAVVELLAAARVYRVYLQPGRKASRTAQELLRAAHERAVRARPDLTDILDGLLPAMTLTDDSPAGIDFGVRLQQTWGPVMAKGIEDKTFYRWSAFVAMNEVGSDPGRLAQSDADELHAWSLDQQKRRPQTMTTLSTHDTKRSEDVRARLLAVGGDPEAWSTITAATLAAAAEDGIDSRTAHFVWQTLLGVGEISDQRLADYLRKALREAAEHTSWLEPDDAYEQQVIDFATRIAADGPAHDALRAALAANDRAVRAVVLGTKVVQLTLPGVPDTYQGTELVDLSLVDPDNRRAVDFDRRSALLSAGDTSGLDAAKQHVVTAALHARRDHPRVFGPESSYRPVVSDSEHLLGFSRSVAGRLARSPRETFVTLATRAPARLYRSGGWANATVDLASGEWHDHVSGVTLTSDGHLGVADILIDWPVALLEKMS